MSVGDSNPLVRRIVVLVVVTAVFMSNLDLWIVNVALVDIGHGLGGSLSALSWVLNAYAVTLAALLIPAGRLGDRIGHRQVFLAGMALFTVASIACALANDLGVLVGSRIVQAAGAALLLPSSLALLLASVEPHKRLGAARGWSAVGAMSAVAGPVLGGLLVEISWRWVFIVNVPIGVVAVAAGLRVLPREHAREQTPVPDLFGSGLLVMSVAALTGGLVQGPTWGWTSARTIGLFVVAAAGAVWFIQRCRVHESPMLELALLRVRRFAVSNAASFVFSAAFAIMLLSNALWCQTIWHWSPIRTGLALAPGPGMVPLVTFASARVVHRFGAGFVAAAGSLLFGVGMVWRVAAASAHADYVRDLLPSMMIGGIGVGLALSTLIAAAATSLPPHRFATASAIVNSGRQIASALGVAVFVTILSSSAVVSVHDYRIGWIVAAAMSVVAAAASLGIPHTRPAAAPRASSERTVSPGA
jgi:EmrB/QacA subfamily drug resistance transporter